MQLISEQHTTVLSLSGGSTMSGGVISIGVQLIGATSGIQGDHQFKCSYSIKNTPYTHTVCHIPGGAVSTLKTGPNGPWPEGF